MTLRELVRALRRASSDREVLGLAELFERWRTSASNADELSRSVEAYIGDSTLASAEQHRSVYALWSTFSDECIKGRRGMTMNERLYFFDLLDAWDSARTEEARNRIRLKVDFPKSGKAASSASAEP